MCLLRVAALGSLLLALIHPAAAQNVMENSGFEKLGPAGRPVGWRLVTGAKVLQGPGIGRRSNTAVRVRFTDSASQGFAVKPRSCYALSCWVKREKPGAEVPKIKFSFTGAKGKRLVFREVYALQ